MKLLHYVIYLPKNYLTLNSSPQKQENIMHGIRVDRTMEENMCNNDSEQSIH